VVGYNQRLVDMWRIPSDVISRGDDESLLQFAVDQLADPSAFLARVRQVYSHPAEESSDVLLFKDGRVFERTSIPQRLGDEVVGRVWSFTDVTDARRNEVLRGRFLDMAGHEMRSPLSVVSGFAGVLLMDWDTLDDTTKRDYVDRIRNQTDKLGYVVDSFLLTSRLDAGKLEPRVTPIDLTSEVRGLAAEHAGTTVETADRVTALADPTYLRNMVLNYLSNAEKYGKPPVTVTVDMNEGFARVCVEDAGDGIPPELVADLFERFSPTREALNPKSPGSGLGLWIVRELARAQGGDAWYESSAHGPRFCFRLPLAE
jgi:signal transduction histidine kinase